MQLPARGIDHVLDRWPVARLATIGADGAPHQVPIVFARVGGTLWSPVDGKPKSGGVLARERNIAQHPAVSLLLDDYDADWSRLWWVRASGQARVWRPVAPHDDAELSAISAALREKYPQYRDVDLLRDAPSLIGIEVERVTSWCAGPEAIGKLR